MASDPPEPRPPKLDYSKGRVPSRPLPSGTAAFGMWLFLISLSMLFASAMIAYIAIRYSTNDRTPKPGSLHFPAILWLSTVLVITVSVALSSAVKAIRLEHPQTFRTWLFTALSAATGFLLIQTPAMISLLRTHAASRQSTHGTLLYGLIFVLILLHALHVIGGMVALIRVTTQSLKGVYDHEHFQPVRFATLYWHFLDIVWVLMFLTFLLTA